MRPVTVGAACGIQIVLFPGRHSVDAGLPVAHLVIVAEAAVHFFQALGMPKPAFILSLARQLLFLLPLVLVLPKVYGLNGVWASFPFSDFMAFGLAVGLLWWEYRRVGREEEKRRGRKRGGWF